MAGEKSNIVQNINIAKAGIDLDSSVSQIPQGKLSYALNASLENFDSNSISYQNEPGNVLCINFPEDYQVIGKHSIIEQGKHIFFLANPVTQDSEIGYIDNNECIYHKYINAKCLNFSIEYPIHKVVHKITNCTIEIYWTDAYNNRRYLDLNNIPYKTIPKTNSCDVEVTSEIDCNKLNVQPNFSIPEIIINKVSNGGNLVAGTVQFAVQYANSEGQAYTSYYSVTNPTPIAVFVLHLLSHPMDKQLCSPLQEKLDHLLNM